MNFLGKFELRFLGVVLVDITTFDTAKGMICKLEILRITFECRYFRLSRTKTKYIECLLVVVRMRMLLES